MAGRGAFVLPDHEVAQDDRILAGATPSVGHRRATSSSVGSAAVRPGDPVLLRSVFRGRVRFTAPHRYVGEDAGRLVLYRQPGSEARYIRRDARGRYLERWVGDETTTSFRWARTHVLLLVRPHEAHSLDLFWDERWNFLGWYVNLQTPLTSTPLGFDMTDHALDIWVEADGRWSWKDEADFLEAQQLGVFDARQAAAVRAEGERVIAAKPWPTGWENWRPPPTWGPLELPNGWDVAL